MKIHHRSPGDHHPSYNSKMPSNYKPPMFGSGHGTHGQHYEHMPFKPPKFHGGPGGGKHWPGKMPQFSSYSEWGNHHKYSGTGGPKPDYKADPMHYHM